MDEISRIVYSSRFYHAILLLKILIPFFLKIYYFSILKDIDFPLVKNEVVGDLLHNLGRFYFYSFVFFSISRSTPFFYRSLSLFLKNQFLLLSFFSVFSSSR